MHCFIRAVIILIPGLVASASDLYASTTCGSASTSLVVELPSPASTSAHFNWFKDGADRDRGAALGMLEPLFATDPVTSQRVGWLATEAEWVEDPRIFRLHLRQNVRWSDGEIFDSEDVALTIRIAMKHAGLNGLHVERIRDAVQDALVEDSHHLLITLNEGHGDFVDEVLTAGDTDALAVVPAHLWLGVDPNSTEVPIAIGTGPYRLGSTSPEMVSWERRADWWGKTTGWQDLPEPEALVWRTQTDDEDRARQLTRGCSDVAMGLSMGVTQGVMDVAPFVFPPADNSDLLYSFSNWSDFAEETARPIGGMSRQSSQWILHQLH